MPPKNKVVSNTTPTTEKVDYADVDEFELYNSLNFNIDISIPYKRDL